MDQCKLEKFNRGGRINYLFSLLSINKSFRKKIGGGVSLSSKNGLIIGNNKWIVLNEFKGFINHNLFIVGQWTNGNTPMIYIDINRLKDIPKRRDDIYEAVINLLFLIEKINRLIEEFNTTCNENDTKMFHYHKHCDLLKFYYNKNIYAINDDKNLYKDFNKPDKNVLTLLSQGPAKEIVDLDKQINNLLDESISSYLLLREL